MSSPEEHVQQEVAVEEVSAEIIETVDLLNGFGLSVSIIESFIANEYTAETLRIIERREVEELIPVPFLAERTKCINGLNTWRKAQGLPTLVDRIPLQSILPSTENTVTRENCTAAYLLGSSPKGQQIIQQYRDEKFLSRSDKKSITHIVVDEFKDRFSKLTPTELLDRAIELHRLFPSEPQEIWYQPTWTKDSAGKKIKIRKQAKGRLYDRNVNYKEATKDKPIQPSSSQQHQQAEGGHCFTDQQGKPNQKLKCFSILPIICLLL
ncbi:uncharacterized protein LOC131685199 [Topomyia yanbarensis]|uniref:uncharacterized protein LOC131685199 n=1 Tax=Topomyia yanbarensis TaxID=2498891 RepID=UPI00273CF02F|nr:uncharacterized protein LOC131685199 [Topomyia yanbarensis]